MFHVLENGFPFPFSSSSLSRPRAGSLSHSRPPIFHSQSRTATSGFSLVLSLRTRFESLLCRLISKAFLWEVYLLFYSQLVVTRFEPVLSHAIKSLLHPAKLSELETFATSKRRSVTLKSSFHFVLIRPFASSSPPTFSRCIETKFLSFLQLPAIFHFRFPKFLKVHPKKTNSGSSLRPVAPH